MIDNEPLNYEEAIEMPAMAASQVHTWSKYIIDDILLPVYTYTAT